MITLEQLSIYLPYKLKVKFNGIVNGKEIKAYCDKYNSEQPWDSMKEFNPPDEVVGEKEGFIKGVGLYKNHTVYEIGVFYHGLKKYYAFEHNSNQDFFKPLLHPISKISEEIEVNGKKFIPMEQLYNECSCDAEREFFELLEDGLTGIEEKALFAPYTIIAKLAEWHIDIFGLIDKGLAEPIK